MNVKEILVDLTLFNSLINRAIYNQCEIVLFDETKPEKFEVEMADLASRHADTVTVYKSLNGKMMFASDLHFNPYNVKVIANVAQDFEDKFTDLLDDKAFSVNDKQYHITNVRYRKDEEEIKVEYTENVDSDNEKDKMNYLESFYYWLNNNASTFKSDDFSLEDLNNLWTEYQSAIEEDEEFQNQPEYGTDLGLLKVIDEHAGDIESIHTDYSGRAMYGDTCFGIVVSPHSEIIDALKKYDVMGTTDSMGFDIIIYWPSKKFESLKAKDENDVLSQFNVEDEDEVEATARASFTDVPFYRKPQKDEMIQRDSDKVKMNDEIAKLPVFDEKELFGEEYSTVVQDFIKEDVPQYFVMKTHDGLDFLVDTQGANYVRYAILIDTDLSHEFDEADACDMTEASEYALKPLIAELESKGYTIFDEGSHDDITVYVANSKEEFADDIFLALIFGSEREYDPQVGKNPLPQASYSLVDIVNSNFKEKYPGKYAEVEEIAKRHEKKDETEAVRMESLASSDCVYKIVKQPLNTKETSFAQQMVFEALEMSDDAKATVDEIKKHIENTSLWGYYQKSNPGTLRRARENPELVQNGLDELVKDGYVVKEEAAACDMSEALHPEQKGGQEIKLRKIADKYIDEVAKHANTGIVQHAILDPEASDLNKEQIASVRKALVEVGNRNMGNDRIRKEGKEGVIAGSDIAEWASWLTSDCMAFTADYLMENIGNRNAKDAYAFAKAKLEDCLLDFYRTDMNKANYPEVYSFWEDLIYGQKAFGASEGDDFFTVYLMKEKTPEELQAMCTTVETAFETECAIVDNSAFNVYKLGKLKGNETAMNDVASLVGQSEILEMA